MRGQHRKAERTLKPFNSVRWARYYIQITSKRHQKPHANEDLLSKHWNKKQLNFPLKTLLFDFCKKQLQVAYYIMYREKAFIITATMRSKQTGKIISHCKNTRNVYLFILFTKVAEFPDETITAGHFLIMFNMKFIA